MNSIQINHYVFRIIKDSLRFSTVVLMIVLLCLPVFANTEHPEGKKKVLLLNSYHKGYYWTDEITRGVEESVSNSNFDLHIEYMDTKRQFHEEYQTLLTKLIKLKHCRHNYDVIIVSDNNAFEFMKKFKNEIAGTTPIVFCGVNYIEKVDLYGMPEYSGINERADILGNLQLIKKIHPHTNKIVIITDNTTTGKSVQNEVHRIDSLNLPEGIDTELWYDYSAIELINKIKNIEKNTIVLYTFFFRDKENVFYEFDVSAEMITEHCKVPVYGCWDFSLGYGIVGGLLTSGFDQGQIAGQKAIKIINGTTFLDQQIDNNTTTRLLFDYKQIIKYGIDLSLISNDYELINQPETFFYRNKEFILKLVGLFFLMLLLIVFLIFGFFRTLQLKRQLVENKVQMSSLISNMPGAVYRSIVDQKWRMVFLSEQIKNICGFEAKDFIEEGIKSIPSIIYLDDIEYVRSKIDSAIENNYAWEISYRVLHKNGSTRWVTEYGRGVKDSEGNVAFLDGLIIDITKRKNAEKERQKTDRKFEKVFNNSPIGMLYYDKDGEILDCNESFAQILETPKDKLVGFNMLVELKDKTLHDEVKNSLTLGAGYYSDYYTSIISGSKVPVRCLFKGILDDIGIYSSGIGIIENVTDQIKAEREILEANEQLLATNDELFATTDALQDANEDLLNALEEAKRSKELELANEELRKSDKILRIAHADIQLKQKELQRLNVELKSSHDSMQQLNEKLISVNDQLYEQKEELESTIQKLKEAQMHLITSEKMASVGILTAGIAHEINNPLNYIQGGKTAIELFIEDNLEDYSNELNVYLEMIQTGIEKAVKIISGLNHFNRRSEEFTEICDIYSILNNCLVMLDNHLKHRVDIVKSYTTEQFCLIGNEGRLHPAISILEKNILQQDYIRF